MCNYRYAGFSACHDFFSFFVCHSPCQSWTSSIGLVSLESRSWSWTSKSWSWSRISKSWMQVWNTNSINQSTESKQWKARVGGHYAVQGRSRSLIFVPINFVVKDPIKPTIALALRLCSYCTRQHMKLTIWNFTCIFLQFAAPSKCRLVRPASPAPSSLRLCV